MDLEVREDRCFGTANKVPAFAHPCVKAMPKSLGNLQQVHGPFPKPKACS